MKRALFLIMLLLVLGSGCTTAVKQAYYTARGPQGSFLVEEAEPESSFAPYTVAVVERFTNRLPNHVSPGLVASCQVETMKELGEAGYFDDVVRGGGEMPAGALLIRGTLVDFKAGSVPGQRAVGGGDHLIAHVQLVDGGTGKVMAWAVVRGLVKSAAQLDEENFAEGMAKGIEEFVEEVTGREEVED